MSSESDSRTEEVDSDIKSTMFYASREENGRTVQSSSSTLHISWAFTLPLGALVGRSMSVVSKQVKSVRRSAKDRGGCTGSLCTNGGAVVER